MKFSEWYSEADMPTKLEDGTWVDLETGLPFDSGVVYAKVRKSISNKAQDARNIAKAFGGKALKGTAKQKEWAEKIRAEKLAKMQFEDAVDIVTVGGFLDLAKFWIENRDKNFTLSVVLEEFKKLKDLRVKHYDTLARSGLVSDKNAAKAEIINTIKSLKVKVVHPFPNFDPYLEIDEQERKAARAEKMKQWTRR